MLMAGLPNSGKILHNYLKNKNFSDAKLKIIQELEKNPKDFKLLLIALEIHRKSGDREKSLEYSELLISNHPKKWDGYGRSAQDLAELKRFEQAQDKIKKGLSNFPNQLNLLLIASDVYRKSGDREKSLEYSELLISNHPKKWDGYGRSAQDLAELKRFEQAQDKIKKGLSNFPNQLNLLLIASDVYRKSGDREKSLEYSELLISNHPKKWDGYGRSAQDLAELKRFEQAQQRIKAGLLNFPSQFNLLLIAIDVYRKSGDRENSLMHALHIIEYHPEKWDGYARAAQDLALLKQVEDAKKVITEGLRRRPTQAKLLIIANDIYREAGEYETSLKYAELLITHHPENCQGVIRACKDKLSVGDLNISEYQEKAALSKIYQLGDKQFMANLCKTNDILKRDLWIDSYKIHRQSPSDQEIVPLNTWQPFQFWSQGEPPEQILDITSTWNKIFAEIGVAPIKLYNHKTALRYINDHCPELNISFKTAFHYAVEADIFRVAFAQKNNCIWLDSDLYPKIHTKKLLHALLLQQKTTLFFRSHFPWITNAFFITPAHSKFFANILKATQGTDFTSLPQDLNTVGKTFGPGRFNIELDTLLLQYAESLGPVHANRNWSNIGGISFANEHTFASMAPPFQLNYKNTNDNWQKFLVSL